MSVPQIFPSVTTLGIISYFGVGVKCFFLTDVYSIVCMENIAISFLISCLASIAAYYVCKWLDGDK